MVRDEITKYLSTVMQSTAKTLSEKLCMDRLAVSRELNAMVSEGMLERKLEGANGRHSEYQYWLTRKDVAAPADGVDMHPKTLPAGAVAIPRAARAAAEKPEVTEAEVSAVEESLDLALQLQAVTRERDELKAQCSTLEDKASVLQLNFDRQAVAHHDTVAKCDKLRDMLDECQLSRDQWKSKHGALQQQIDQYDERQRFETWFAKRIESKGSTESTSLKEKMWESWLERSKVVEVAA